MAWMRGPLALTLLAALPASAATHYAGSLGDLRIDRRRPLVLHHGETIATGSLATAVSVTYATGQTQPLGVAPGGSGAYHCVIQPAALGPITVRISGASDTTVYTANVVALAPWERAIGVRKRSHSLVTAKRADAVATGTTGLFSPGGSPAAPATRTAIIADAADSGNNVLNARKAGALTATGNIYRITAYLVNPTLISWVQWHTVRWTSGTNYTVISSTETFGDANTNGTPDVPKTFTTGVNTFDLARPLQSRAGDYLAITVRGITTGNVLAGDVNTNATLDPGGTRYYRTLTGAPGAVGATADFSTEVNTNVLWRVDALVESPGLLIQGDSLGGPEFDNGSPVDDWNPVDAASDLSILLRDAWGIETAMMRSVGGVTTTGYLTDINSNTIIWEPAICVLSLGTNDLVNSSASASGLTSWIDKLFGFGPSDTTLTYTRGVVQTLRTNGILPVLLTIPPIHKNRDTSSYPIMSGADNDALLAFYIRSWNRTLARACASTAVPCIDRYGVWGGRRNGDADVNGNELAYIGTGFPDPVHPGNGAGAALAQAIALGLQHWSPITANPHGVQLADVYGWSGTQLSDANTSGTPQSALVANQDVRHVTGDVSGKVVGGGATAITGTGAQVQVAALTAAGETALEDALINGADTLNVDSGGAVTIQDGTGTGQLNTQGGDIVAARNVLGVVRGDSEISVGIAGVGVWANDRSGATLASESSITTVLARIGSFGGTGNETILGAVKAIASKTAAAISAIGGTYDPATDSLEAIRDRGDAAWTGGGSGIGGSLAVTLTVQGSGTALSGAKVTVRNVADTATLDVQVTNGSGQVVLAPDSGVSYKVYVTAAGQATFSNPYTKDYSTNGTDTINGTAISIAAPSDPQQSTCYFLVTDTTGVTGTATAVNLPDALSGVLVVGSVVNFSAATSPTRITCSLYQGVTYRVRVPLLGVDHNVTIPATATSDLGDLLGIE